MSLAKVKHTTSSILNNYKIQKMKTLMPLLFLLIIASCKKEEFDFKLTKEFSIQSKINDGNYKITVGLPENYDPSTQKYATIYVLDGDDNFDLVAEKCKTLSQDYATSNVLVVGIGYGYDRAIDFTPTKANEGGGGADKFLQFIEKELIPQMELDYGADSSRNNRIILGHSFGGLLASYAFTNYNNVFGNYLILSPSIWYDNEIILQKEQDNRSNNQESQHLVFMGLGELENSGRMLAPFDAFYQRLKNNYPAIKLSKHIEPQLNHQGSKNPNITEALTYYFKNK